MLVRAGPFIEAVKTREAVSGESWMKRYLFILFDDNKVNISNRDFVATDDAIAVLMAEEWRDHRGAQVWRDDQLVKHWKRRS